MARTKNATRFCLTATEVKIGAPVKAHVVLDVTILDKRLAHGQSVMLPLSGLPVDGQTIEAKIDGPKEPLGMFLTVFRVKG